MSQCVTPVKLDLRADGVETLQMNITRLCNQACAHCHLEAGPERDEMMPREVIDACIGIVAESPGITTVDITGGAPELHPDFRYLVERMTALGRRVIVRHNLTVTLDPHPRTGASMEWLPEFFASQRVDLVSSLPCYTADNVDRQRGDGVFEKSIESLRRLNAVGYGVEGSGLSLDLVYNPGGAGLPGPQAALEVDYHRELAAYDVRFNHLISLANMPLGRFERALESTGRTDEYLGKVHGKSDPALGRCVMCRSLVSVGPDGTLYDCDFHQAAGIPVAAENGGSSAFGFDLALLSTRPITWADHCEVCIAGEGSSCFGGLR